jgi:UPF0755 protein
MAADRTEKRRRRRGGFVDILNGFLTLLVLGIIAAGGLFFWGASQFYADGQVTADTNFLVERGSRLGTIAERLEEQGLVSSKYIFQVGTWALKKQSEIKAGEFVLKANSSMADVLTEITEGKPLLLAVVVPEGWTSWQVAERLKDNPDLTGELPAAPEEGTILPGSYDYERGMARTDVLARMQAAMATRVAEVFARCDPTICGPDGVVRSPAELITLASIVERETGVASERPEVAAVFVNRLKKNMRLQSDPTIIYGITKGVGRLDRPIRRSEIQTRDEYNTYQLDGLPAGPIANPGIEALEAVARPAVTDSLYFVARTADPRDGHLFATTYAEHRRNVAEYRKATAEAAAESAKEALEAEEAAKNNETGDETGDPAVEGDAAAPQ